MLNKSKGDMYSFFNNYPYEYANRGCTWNPIKGLCQYQCSYCFMIKMYKRYKWNTEFRLDEKCFKDKLGECRYIFVGSSTDMFAENVPNEWISRVLNYCRFEYPKNQYFFQSKNPGRFNDFILPDNSIICTTIETNRGRYIYRYSRAPQIVDRINGIKKIEKYRKMITIEPIMAFDLLKFIDLIYDVKPIQVNIGADSGNNNLPEPPKEKIEALIKELRKFTKVELKKNLGRLLK